MPLIQSATAALPYVDPVVTGEALSSAQRLIEEELALEQRTTLHPSIPATRESRISELVQAEHERIASGEAKDGGIDLSRYEALESPPTGELDAWRTALQTAYASTEYLRGREINLGLLETYGRNAWLIANSQLEDELKSLEHEVEAKKLELEQVEQESRTIQSNANGEMQSLEETWRVGIGRMIEAQAAGEKLRMEILQRRRQAAS